MFNGLGLLVIRILTFLAMVPLLIWVYLQRIRGQADQPVTYNRLGRATVGKPERPIIWIHAASLGELSAVRPFLAHMTAEFPNYQLLITTNNPTALDVALEWSDVNAILQAAPVDLPFVIRRFLRHWAPIGFINVESEIWPTRFAALANREIPAVMLNARLSDGSARQYQRLGGRAIGLDFFAKIFAQDPKSADNFRALGLPAEMVKTIPNFKSLVQNRVPSAELQEAFPRNKTLLAASTHAGEDQLILSAYALLREADPDLQLIMAPRHPGRVQAIEALAKGLGLSTRLLFETDRKTPIVIVDRLGLLQELYGLARVTFVGGSLLPDIGGHTPYEPIVAGTAIVSGSFVENFKLEYDILHKAAGCLIAEEQGLAQSLADAFLRADALSAAAASALPVFENPREVFDQVTDCLGITS